MLKLTICFAFVWNLVNCDDCSSPANLNKVFVDYMQCMKNNVTQNFGAYETEIFQDSRQAVDLCFARSIAEGNRSNHCVLALSDLAGRAWDKDGPLRHCSLCQTFAKSAINAILSSQNKNEQKCIRSEIMRAVAAEADYCLTRKLQGFAGSITFPDFEEGSFEHREAVINSISDHIWVNSRLAFCHQRNPRVADATKKCLKNPFDNYYNKHCDALKACTANIPNICTEKIHNMKKATCSCVEDARGELKLRISGIAQQINEIVNGSTRNGPTIEHDSKASQCVAAIKQFVRTDVNDWIEVIDKALTKCFSSRQPGQNFGLDSMISVGCRKAIADTTGTASTQLKIGFDFINNLVDVMVDRSGRFCGGDYCQ